VNAAARSALTDGSTGRDIDDQGVAQVMVGLWVDGKGRLKPSATAR
jgi:hypothetical protein